FRGHLYRRLALPRKSDVVNLIRQITGSAGVFVQAVARDVLHRHARRQQDQRIDVALKVVSRAREFVRMQKKPAFVPSSGVSGGPRLPERTNRCEGVLLRRFQLMLFGSKYSQPPERECERDERRGDQRQIQDAPGPIRKEALQPQKNAEKRNSKEQ